MTYSVPGLVRTHLVSSSYMGTVDSPFVRTRAVIDQMKGWEIMKAVTSGTEYLRENCETFLPLEPVRTIPRTYRGSTVLFLRLIRSVCYGQPPG